MKEALARFAIPHPILWMLGWWIVGGLLMGLLGAAWLGLILGTGAAIYLRRSFKTSFPELAEQREADKPSAPAATRDEPRPLPAAPSPARKAVDLSGSAGRPIIVVGTDHYDGLRSIAPGLTHAVVHREPNNPHDSNAMAVWAGATPKMTGYFSAYQAEKYAPLMDAAGVATIRIRAELEPDGKLFVNMPDLTEAFAPPPAPVAADWRGVDAWGRRTHSIRIEGSELEIPPLRRVLKDHAGPDRDDSAYGVPGIAIAAGQRLSIIIDGYAIGRTDQDSAAPYIQPLSALAESRQGVNVTCNLWLADYNPTYSNVTIYLPEPDEIEPPPTLPEEPHIVLPAKSKIQVTGEEAYLNELTLILGDERRVPVAVTLHEMTPASGRGKQYVEVRIADDPVGKLTPTMSEHMLPIIRACAEEHLLVVCRATVEGNHLKADVVLDTTKSGDLPQEWILEHVQAPDDYEPPVTAPAPAQQDDW